MNGKKVKALYLGIPHWLASCQDCNWQNEFSNNRANGYKEARNHVRQTGHTVSIESSHVTHYFMEDAETDG